jgi:hypothetical protein
MTTKKKNAVAKTTKNELAIPFDYGTHAGAGTDDLSQSERGVPFLKILQPLSPECVGPQGKIEGAAAGMLLNTGTEELFDSLTVLPTCRIHKIQEWRPRDEGGGLVNETVIEPGADYPAFYKEAMARQEADGRDFGDFWTGEPKKSNQLAETYQLWCAILDPETQEPTGMVVVPFSSSAIGVYRKQYARRIGRLRGNPPMFAFPIVLTTLQETNKKGTWSNYVVSFPVENNPIKSAIDPTSNAFAAGVELFDLVKGGHVKADEQGAASARADGEGGGDEDSGPPAF